MILFSSQGGTIKMDSTTNIFIKNIKSKLPQHIFKVQYNTIHSGIFTGIGFGNHDQGKQEEHQNQTKQTSLMEMKNNEYEIDEEFQKMIQKLDSDEEDEKEDIDEAPKSLLTSEPHIAEKQNSFLLNSDEEKLLQEDIDDEND